MKQLTREKAAALFHKYAFYVSSGDVIAEDTARAILSDEAVDFAKRQGSTGQNFSIFGVGGNKQFSYLTLAGFMAAVSFYNVSLIFSEPQEGNIIPLKPIREGAELPSLKAGQKARRK